MPPVIVIDDGSDDVEIIERPKRTGTSSSRREASESFICQICQADLNKMDLERRQLHYDQHLREGPSSSVSSPDQRASSSSKAKSATKPNFLLRRVKNSTDAFWHPAQDVEPPSNYTPGLIPILKRALTSSHEKDATLRAVLCYDRTVHIHHETWDSGWGCGYRNFVMACTALMDQSFQPDYYALLNTPQHPSVRNLQLLIEEAWRQGYDEEGAGGLEHQLVEKKKWIGTADLFVAFTYRGIPAQLADFDISKTGPKPLTDWIKAYFIPPEKPKGGTIHDALRGRSPVVVMNQMPLVLQHEGHSRMVVGYEITKNGTNLLIFDPSKRIPEDLRKEAIARFFNSASQGGADRGHQGDSKGQHGTRLFQQAMKPFRDAQCKRRASNSPTRQDQTPVKRMRAGQADVIVIDDDGETCEARGEEENRRENRARQPEAPQKRNEGESKMDTKSVLKLFRFDEKHLIKKDKYQILWFPLEDPLDQKGKQARRVVTSDKVY